ncbi:MAG: hypothetical protein ACKO96_05075 [Flammeovirgaceae bacterium]
MLAIIDAGFAAIDQPQDNKQAAQKLKITKDKIENEKVKEQKSHTNIVAGEIIQFTTGRYNYVEASFVALKDFCLKDIFTKTAEKLIDKDFALEIEEHISSHSKWVGFYKANYSIAETISIEHIYNYLLRNKFIVSLNIRKMNICDNDFGQGLEMLFSESLEELEAKREKQFLDYIEKQKQTTNEGN